MNIEKLASHPYAQCQVRVYDNGDVCFQSYTTDVVYYRASSHLLYITGTYSQTTRNHIGWFLKEFFPNVDYHDLKVCYEHDAAMCDSGRWSTPLHPNEVTLLRWAHNGMTLSPEAFCGL